MKLIELKDSFVLHFDRFLFFYLVLFSCCFTIWSASATLSFFECAPSHKRRISSQSRRGYSSAESKMSASKVSITTQWSTIPLSTRRTIHTPRANSESHMNGLYLYVVHFFGGTSRVSTATATGITCKSGRISRNLDITVMSCHVLKFFSAEPCSALHKRATPHIPSLHRHSGRREAHSI